MLVWAEPPVLGGAIRALELNPRGQPSGPDRPVGAPATGDADGAAGAAEAARVLELSVAHGGGRTAVAWLARASDGAQRVWATRGQGSTFGPAVDLGPTEVASPARRGALAVAASESGALDVMFQSTRRPCRDGDASQACMGIDHWQPSGRREGVSLVVPDPCPAPIVGYLVRHGRWYFGVCAGEGDDSYTTLYAIEHEPQYAHVERLHAGCAPLGLAPAADGALLVVRCGDELRATHVAQAGRAVTDLGRLERAVRCGPEGMELHLRGQHGQGVVLPLTGPLSRIETWLAEDLAPAGARAVWTGQALLVAAPAEEGVRVCGHRCGQEALELEDFL
jgi:hypothetical protein